MKAVYVQPSVDFFGLKVRGRSIWGGAFAVADIQSLVCKCGLI